MLSLGEEQTVVTPDGREWTLGRLELGVVRAFKKWVAAQVGDPFAVLDRYLGKVADAELMPFFKEAKDQKEQLQAFDLGCPLAWRFLGTLEGLTALCHLLLKARHPQATEEDAFAVAFEVNKRLAEAVRKAAGSLPNAPAAAAAPAPAAPTGSSSTSG